ncbi:MAG: sigma-70 family RNA polymerase sigma factor [Pseudomonadota bacterium]|nr:sigma-70 family RNA polymerase sigma factor [Pseudomonadota bacterium]
MPADGLPDDTLALRAQHGDRKAFEVLIGRHKAALYRLLRSYLGNRDDAYDLLQDTLICVWESLPRYDPTRSFFAWTRTIALNKCRDHTRRQRFRAWFSQALAAETISDSLSSADQTEMDDAQREQEGRLKRLDAAVSALPARYKEPLLLTTVEGMTQKAVAILLRTTPKAIELRLRRARRRLLERLNGASESDATYLD